MDVKIVLGILIGYSIGVLAFWVMLIKGAYRVTDEKIDYDTEDYKEFRQAYSKYIKEMEDKKEKELSDVYKKLSEKPEVPEDRDFIPYIKDDREVCK